MATGINGNDTDDSYFSAGAVYVFRFLNNTWSQQAYVKPSSIDAYDYFGSSIDLGADGNTLVSCANREDSDSTLLNSSEFNTVEGENSGACYLFKYQNNAWSQQTYIKASNTGTNDYFGTSVSISDDGNNIAIGAEGEDSNASLINGDQIDNTFSGAGAIYLY